MIGRIIGESISELQFRTYYDRRVNLGEILQVADSDDGRRLLVRVIDILYGHDSHDEDWLKRTAGSMLAMEREGGGFALHDREQRLFEVGVAVPLGYVVDGRLRKAKSLPAHLSAVSRPREEDYEFLGDEMGELRVGLLRSGEETLGIPVGIRGGDLVHHIGIFATTGMGKSNLMRVLATSIMRSGRHGHLLMDPHGEYLRGANRAEGGLADLPDAQGRLVVLSGNPQPGEHPLQFSSSELDPADLAEVYTVSDPQRELCYAIREVYRERWARSVHEQSSESLRDRFANFNEATVGVVKRRIDSLYDLRILHDNADRQLSPLVIDALAEARTVVVDTSFIGAREEMLALSILARRVFRNARWLYGEDRARFEAMPSVLITVEEAQRVLGRERSTIFSTIAREGRKFKVGVCAISQQPKLLNPEVISQFNTLFVLGLSDKRDREILAESAKQDIATLSKEIQTLGVGEGLVASPSLPFAVPFRADFFRDVRAAGAVAGARPGGAVARPPLDERFFG